MRFGFERRAPLGVSHRNKAWSVHACKLLVFVVFLHRKHSFIEKDNSVFSDHKVAWFMLILTHVVVELATCGTKDFVC